MPPIYSNPIAKLREWADAVRLDHPDVWNDLEDLAQSFEAKAESAPDEVAGILAVIRAAPYRKRTGAKGLDDEDVYAVMEAFEVTAGTNEALSILGCGSVADLVAEDVATELRNAAMKAKALHSLVDEIVTTLDIDASWLEYDSAIVAGDLPRLQKWCAGVLAAVRRPDAEIVQGQAAGLANQAAENELLRAELAAANIVIRAVQHAVSGVKS